jgi:hypothetical protein
MSFDTKWVTIHDTATDRTTPFNANTLAKASNGDPGKDGVLGAEKPELFDPGSGWRAFWTQQHGDNFTWELLRTHDTRSDDSGDHDD